MRSKKQRAPRFLAPPPPWQAERARLERRLRELREGQESLALSPIPQAGIQPRYNPVTPLAAMTLLVKLALNPREKVCLPVIRYTV